MQQAARHNTAAEAATDHGYFTLLTRHFAIQRQGITDHYRLIGSADRLSVAPHNI